MERPKFIFTLLFIGLAISLNGQLKRDHFTDRLNEFKRQFRNCVVEDETLALPIYSALSFFPELKNIPIEVKWKKMNYSMICRPSVIRFLKITQTYIIFINNDRSSPFYPFKADFSSSIGCLGHELSHILRYESQSKKEIITDCFKYLLSKRFKSNYEKNTDIITAKKGLGFENYEFEKYIKERAGLSKKRLKRRYKIYNEAEDLWVIYRQYHK